jgi:hypothetical protein
VIDYHELRTVMHRCCTVVVGTHYLARLPMILRVERNQRVEACLYHVHGLKTFSPFSAMMADFAVSSKSILTGHRQDFLTLNCIAASVSDPLDCENPRISPISGVKEKWESLAYVPLSSIPSFAAEVNIDPLFFFDNVLDYATLTAIDTHVEEDTLRVQLSLSTELMPKAGVVERTGHGGKTKKRF